LVVEIPRPTTRRMSYATKHDWYKVPEISLEQFLLHVKPLYDILEGKKPSKSEPDPFAHDCYLAYYGQSQEQWEEDQKRWQAARAWSMAIGTFHQNIMGSCNGWVNYGKGHTTGCDIGKNDSTCVAEVKNNINTMNSDSRKSVLQKLNKQKDLGKRAMLVIVNAGDMHYHDITGIEWISGRKFYQEITGRKNFIDDLLSTLSECLAKFKTFDELSTHLGIS
jgi:hypothetical protein